MFWADGPNCRHYLPKRLPLDALSESLNSPTSYGPDGCWNDASSNESVRCRRYFVLKDFELQSCFRKSPVSECLSHGRLTVAWPPVNTASRVEGVFAVVIYGEKPSVRRPSSTGIFRHKTVDGHHRFINAAPPIRNHWWRRLGVSTLFQKLKVSPSFERLKDCLVQNDNQFRKLCRFGQDIRNS